MNFIVMDLEFNQPFDFETGEKVKLNINCPFEIIQIGLMKIDENFKLISKLNLFVKPSLYKRIHPFVEKITGITEKTLETEKSFPDIFPTVKDFFEGENNVFCVWGGNDVSLLYKNILYYKLEHSNIPKNFINVQSLASSYLKIPYGACIGLKNAVEAMDIEITLPFHDALNDAYYTTEIFKVLYSENCLVENFDIKNIKPKESTKHPFNSNGLFREVEKYFGRKISKKEKEIVKRIYLLGRTKKFDNTMSH